MGDRAVSHHHLIAALFSITFAAMAGCAVQVVDLQAPAARPDGPRLLIVVAHPDDEATFSGAVYKSTHMLGGVCDLLVITNGEGGFKYSTLAESLYGVELTDEPVGRRALPAIRQRELLEGCRIMGVRRVIFLNQRDHRYTQNADEVLGSDAGVWNLPLIRDQIGRTLRKGRYDFVLTLLPTPQTHGHHKAATILTLEAVGQLPPAKRPVILGGRVMEVDQPLALPVTDLPGYAMTRLRNDGQVQQNLAFDRAQAFGYNDRLNYKIIANWVIAAHKSQGTMQLYAGVGDREEYFVYEVNRTDAADKAATWFRSLKMPQFRPKTYGPSAGG